jgi:hypothetical protein
LSVRSAVTKAPQASGSGDSFIAPETLRTWLNESNHISRRKPALWKRSPTSGRAWRDPTTGQHLGGASPPLWTSTSGRGGASPPLWDTPMTPYMEAS